MEETWMEAVRLPESLVVLALLIAFLLLAVFGQRRTWIVTEVVIATLIGAGCAFAPGFLLGYQTTGTLKSTEIALARLYGVTLMCTGLTWYRTRETRDATVTITLMMSRVFTSSTLLMAQWFAWYDARATAGGKGGKETTGPKWGEQFALLGMFPTALWMLGNLLHLFRAHDFSTYPQHNIRLNNHLRIDAWFMLLLGAAWLTFPTQLMAAIMTTPGSNKVALHIARGVGVLCVGEAIVSLQAPGFLHERDKRALFVTRIISTLLQLCALGVSAFIGVVALPSALYVIGGATLPSLANALVGLLTQGTTIYTVPNRGGADSLKINDKHE